MSEPLTIPRAWGLTPSEAKVLRLLHASRSTLSKDELMDALYGGVNEPAPKIVDVFVCKLRTKLALQFPDFEPAIIATIWGKGFRIEEEARALLSAGADAATAAEPKGLAA